MQLSALLAAAWAGRTRPPGRRFFILHCHIYKNAGSSIDHLLWKSFGDDFFILQAAAGHAMLDQQWVRDFLAAYPRTMAISTHGIHPPIDLPGALPLTMLRHPADRARSAYRYARVTPAALDHRVARTASFREYVQWSLATRGDGAVLRDQQVRHLSDAAYRTDDPERWRCTRQDLEQAKHVLRHCFAFGLVRRFAELCRLINTQYRPFMPGLFLRNYTENATGDPAAAEQAVLAEVRAELGDAVYDALCDANTLDLELYRFGADLFARRLARLDRLAGAWRPKRACWPGACGSGLCIPNSITSARAGWRILKGRSKSRCRIVKERLAFARSPRNHWTRFGIPVRRRLKQIPRSPRPGASAPGPARPAPLSPRRARRWAAGP